MSDVEYYTGRHYAPVSPSQFTVCKGQTGDMRLFTSAEREVKDSRRLGMYQSCIFFDKIGQAKSAGFRFYSAI